MISILVPQENVNDQAVSINKIYLDTGEKVEAGQPVVDIETTKSSITIESPCSGYLRHALILGTSMSVGEELFSVIDECDLRGDDISKKLKVNISDEKKNHSSSPWVSSRQLARLGSVSIESNKNSTDHISNSTIVNEKSNGFSYGKYSDIGIYNGGNFISNVRVETKIIGKRIKEKHDKLGLFLGPIIFESYVLLGDEYEFLCKYVGERGQIDLEQPEIGFIWRHDGLLRPISMKNFRESSIGEIEEVIFEYVYKKNNLTKGLPGPVLGPAHLMFTDLSSVNCHSFFPLLYENSSLMIGMTYFDNVFALNGTFDHRIFDAVDVVNFLDELTERVSLYFSNI